MIQTGPHTKERLGGNREKVAVCKPRTETSEEMKGAFILSSEPPELTENKFLLFIWKHWYSAKESPGILLKKVT